MIFREGDEYRQELTVVALHKEDFKWFYNILPLYWKNKYHGADTVHSGKLLGGRE